jgi:lysophospholipase L1-like esterase
MKFIYAEALAEGLLVIGLLVYGTRQIRMANAATPARAADARYLALGDSYTIGEKVAPTERWPVQLAAALRGAGAKVVDPEIIATTGWTTDELKAGIAARDPKGPYELVTLLIGVNNQYRGRSSEQYRGEFRALLAQAIGFADGKAARVVVVSIPDWGVTPFAEGKDRAAIGAAIDTFNAIGRDEATAAGAAFVDITPTSRERHASWEASDGLHPSGAQYTAWTRLILPAAQRALAHRP